MNMDAILRISAKVKGLADLGKLQKGLVGIEGAARDVRGAIGTVVSSASFQATAAAAAGLSAGLALAAREAMRFESSMADVRKVVAGLESETAFKEIQDEILDLTKTIPVAAEGFAEIYAAAGQSGIAREELKDFATLVAQVGIAFDMTAADAGTALSQMRVALGMSTEELRSFADQMNYVSNNSGATASNLVEFMKRAGATGKIAGFAAAETMGLGAAMIQAGAESEVAATSFRNLVRALSAGPNMTDRQIGALNRLGYALQDAGAYEAELTRTVERESQARVDIARDETDQLRREIDRRYRDQLTAIQDSVSDEFDAAEEGIRDRSDAQIKALRREQEQLTRAARERARATNTDSQREVDRINDAYEARIDIIRDNVNRELKIQRRAERDNLTQIRDAMEDRKQIEVDAVEDRMKAVEEKENSLLAQRKEAAKARAEELAAASAQAFSDRFADDAIGGVMDLLKRISELPRAQQISNLTGFIGEEGARGVASLLGNLDELQRLIALAGDEASAAGSVLQEFGVRSETTANKLQLMNNQLKISQIAMGSEVLKAMRQLDEPFKAILNTLADFVKTYPQLSTGLIVVAAGLGAIGLLAPGIAAVVSALKVMAGLKLGAVLLLPIKTAIPGIIAGLKTLAAFVAPWALGIVGTIAGAFKGILALVATVLTGPVGITVLVAAALAGLVYIFREQIAEFTTALGYWLVDIGKMLVEGFKALVQAYFDYWVKPMTEAAKGLWDKVVELAQGALDGMVELFNKLPESIKAPFIVVANAIRSVWNGILTFVTNSLNSFINKVNAAINLANRLAGTKIPRIPTVQGPQEAPSFAGGGYTGNGPRTGGVDGKGGFPAILHPRERVIDLAAGGAMAGGGGSVAMQPAQINITTGPVMQAEGQNWVTMQDLQRAMRATESATMARLRTYAGRRAVGVA
jgi:hypothetical protein